MGTATRIITTSLLVVAMLLPATNAAGWANGDSRGVGFGTHDWVLFEAARLAGDPAWIDMPVALAATDDPDKVFFDKQYHHYDVWGLRYGNSPKKVASVYAQLLKAYGDGDRVLASKYLGHLSHYYSDTCNPIHTDESLAESFMHRSYEAQVSTRTSSPGMNRKWLKYDGYRKATDVRAMTRRAAYASHPYYKTLVLDYRKHGYNLRVSRITKASLNRAVNDLADIIRTVSARRSPRKGFLISTAATEGGSISPSFAVVATSSAETTFTIKAKKGYRIEDVQLGGVSVGRPKRYVVKGVTAHTVLSATFAPIQPESPYFASPATGVYHAAGCSVISGVPAGELEGLSRVSDALSKGYEPCDVCNPPATD